MSQRPHDLETTRAASILMCFLLTFVSPAADAQDSILGQHTLNLRLKPSPVGDILNLLSGRSKAVAKLSDEVRPADEGRPWEVDGAEKLDGIIVAVNFAETPVEQLVRQLLGCVGFGYTERETGISIEKSEQMLPPEQCTSIEQIARHAGASAQSIQPPAASFSFRSESISALEFIRYFSSEAGQNIAVPYNDAETLKTIKLRVEVAQMQQDQVLRSLFDCIGWNLRRTNSGYEGSKPAVPVRGACEQFSVL